MFKLLLYDVVFRSDAEGLDEVAPRVPVHRVRVSQLQADFKFTSSHCLTNSLFLYNRKICCYRDHCRVLNGDYEIIEIRTMASKFNWINK